MSDEKVNEVPGKVVYNVDDEEGEKSKKEARKEVDEADRESFPASDAPGFAGGRITKDE